MHVQWRRTRADETSHRITVYFQQNRTAPALLVLRAAYQRRTVVASKWPRTEIIEKDEGFVANFMIQSKKVHNIRKMICENNVYGLEESHPFETMDVPTRPKLLGKFLIYESPFCFPINVCKS